ncbi:hypothetical protein HY993_05135 [Candidatus Micrarchaeota archaeon]|nr:hypothetical protein [Candidatus Micrarchaeota archaeon]
MRGSGSFMFVDDIMIIGGLAAMLWLPGQFFNGLVVFVIGVALHFLSGG